MCSAAASTEPIQRQFPVVSWVPLRSSRILCETLWLKTLDSSQFRKSLNPKPQDRKDFAKDAKTLELDPFGCG